MSQLPRRRNEGVHAQVRIEGLVLTEASEGAGGLEELAEVVGRLASRRDEIVREFAATLERDGFSDGAFGLAVDKMNEVVQEGSAVIDGMTVDQMSQVENKIESVFDGMEEVIVLALPYAPSDVAEALTVMLEELRAVQDAPGEAASLTPEEARAEANAITRAFEADLQAGESPDLAFSRATAKLIPLAARIASEDDGDGDAAETFLPLMMIDIQRILMRYVPEGMEHTGAEASDVMETLAGMIDFDAEDDASGAVVEGQIRARLESMMQAVQVEAGLEADAPHHLRQLFELMPILAWRLQLAATLTGADGDEAELDRLGKRFEDTLRLIRAKPTEAEIVHHERGGLRRVAVELCQFERRRHLMVAYPALPTSAVTADANRIFFSGSDAVADLVGQACERIHMSAAETRDVGSRTDRRWQLLRGSGIAVLDYSQYDPVRADPNGPIADPTEESDVLGAAGPLAMVAYETGWAYALGTPMVVVTRKGHPIPFDIDVEPVALEGDERDVERLVAGMQVALYGTQPADPGDCLTETVEHVRERCRRRADPLVHELLDGLPDTRDATRVRFVLASVLEQIDPEGALLILPSWPGAYPTESQRRLFHVTGFRDWAAVAHAEVRSACDRAGVEYGIGSARLNPDILKSIWLDICQASFVLADITNLNPNAVLELAIAQALGRPTLIMTQNSRPQTYLPAIEKIRTHRYDPVDGRAELASLLDRFLAGVERPLPGSP